MPCTATPPCELVPMPLSDVSVDWDGPALGRKAVAHPPSRRIYVDRRFWDGLRTVDGRAAILAHERAHLEGARCESCADKRAGAILSAEGHPTPRDGARALAGKLENRDGRAAAADFLDGFGLDDSPKREWAAATWAALGAAIHTSPAARSIILAQLAYESGFGTSTASRAHNFANLTRAATDFGPTIVGGDTDANGAAIVQRFRAYTTTAEGLADYWSFLGMPRYARARSILSEGRDATGFLRALHDAGYYTLSADRYVAGFMSDARQLEAMQLPGFVPVPGASGNGGGVATAVILLTLVALVVGGLV